MIREARETDFDAVMAVEREAFGSDEEAALVADLVNDPTAQPLVSLLAFRRELAVGHVLFTAAGLVEPDSNVRVALLAPLAVKPEYQGKGIGTALVEEGLNRLQDAGVGLVFVLGYPDYYGRFGFAPAGASGLHAPYPIPEKHSDAWMARSLGTHVVADYSGVVSCAKAIDKEMYWVE